MSKMSSSAELDSPGTEGNDLELQITKEQAPSVPLSVAVY